MRVEIAVGDRLREVTVEEDSAHPGRFRVTWDGATRLVDARIVERAGREALLSLVRLDGAASSREVRCVETGAGGGLAVHAGGVVWRTVVNGRRAAGADGGAAGADGEERVTAPMPGKVVRILVAPGDEVAARQPMIVVEAMKMENEMSASRAGTVKEIRVEEGTSVDAGRVLAVVE
ncbi:MAG: acetyl-CoA carboxylase biotin carboxyl carrier protein subunit [Acidobacteria bacterium]|nr:acetyl-CoA carboxylase biotin carboxyl carrier protein subunit [Acidobacteriota bacterium]